MLRQVQLNGDRFNLLYRLVACQSSRSSHYATCRWAPLSSATGVPFTAHNTQSTQLHHTKCHISPLHCTSKCQLTPVPWSPVVIRSFSSDGTSRKSVVSFNLSDIGEGIAEVLVKEWYVTLGQRVNQFDSICEVQSDKASVTITSKFDGVIKKIYYSVDEVAKVGQPLVDIEIDVQSTSSSNQLIDEIDDQDAYERPAVHDFTLPPRSTAPSNLDSYKKTLATPAVRRLAMQNSINLSDVQGTGKDGRVLKEDLLLHLESMIHRTESPTEVVTSRAAETSARVQVPPVSSSVSSSSSSVQSAPATRCQLTRNQTIKVSSVTRAMAKSMTASLSIPHLALADEVNLSGLLQLKSHLQKVSTSTSIKITFLPIMLKAVSLSLTQFPLLNSIYNEPRDEITYIASHNVAFAMATPSGLLVPNVKCVQNLSIYEIAVQVNRLMTAGAKGQLSPDDMTGATFTLSNIGSIGGSFGIPVILSPQVAIGAVGRIREVPRFASSTSNEIIRASIMQVVWSADHRVIDGATVANFSNHWKSLLEDPVKMIIDLK